MSVLRVLDKIIRVIIAGFLVVGTFIMNCIGTLICLLTGQH
jgi:hypothetical protein